MTDDNKTNEELLEEVKKLRKIEEDREDRRLSKIEKGKRRNRFWIIWNIIGWSIIILFFVLPFTCN